ncbi:MAG TPA: hypothetical protein VM711_08705 [Sphingomicrobium sp.]|nr:hypothetical protein [Sphingomicrobium sp.]
MHFHLPKPLHGWREFAGEVGIIVIGVLIALSAEQVVQSWHWRGEVRETNSRLRKDMGYDLAVAYERFAIDPCLRPRLSELRDELLKRDASWPGSRARFSNDLYKSNFPSVYRTPDRPWAEASWQTALNGEVLGHFQPDRVQQFAALFNEVSFMERGQAEEVDTAATLGDLAFAGPISPDERRSDLKIVSKLDALDARLLFLVQKLLGDAREAGLAPDAQVVRALLKQQRSYRGSCVRTGHSLNIGGA